MALPGIVMPSSLPDWLRAPHQLEPGGLYGDAPMQTGHARRRRLRRAAPATLQCEMLVTAAQLEAWHNFHEQTLIAGSRRFAARVAHYGPGHAWYTAEVLSYRMDPRPSLRRYSRISCTLRLHGDPEFAPPVLGSFAAAVRVPLEVRARIVLPTLLRASVAVPLDAVVAGAPLLASVTVPLEVRASLVALAASVTVPFEARVGELTFRATVEVPLEARVGGLTFRASVVVALDVEA